MSTPDSQLTVEKKPQTQNDEFVSVGIDGLVLGRELKFPIYDRNGLLLLSEGSIVTSHFRERLREREIRRVRVHSQDVHEVSESQISGADQPQQPPENAAVTQLLKKTLEQGLQFVTNSGNAARDSRVWHGKALYDSQREKNLKSHFHAQQQSVSHLMQTSDQPERVDINALEQVTADLLMALCEDFDCVNATAMQLSEQNDLSKHCYRMAVLGMSIAIEMGLNDENVLRIGMTGLLHDWGMLKIPLSIRDSALPPTEAELYEIQKHVIHSVNILSRMKNLPTLVSLVSYQTHESMNGTGYPRRRFGNNIHLFARILNVAHHYVEMTTNKRYRKAFTPYEATLDLLQKARRGVIDPVVFRAFLRSQSLFPVGSFVMLSSGRMARVMRSNGDQFTQPIVQVLAGEGTQTSSTAHEEEVLDLSETDCRIVEALPIIHGPEPIPAPHFLKHSVNLKKITITNVVRIL